MADTRCASGVFLLRACGVDDTVSDVYKVVGNSLEADDDRGIVGADVDVAVALGKAGEVAGYKLLLLRIDTLLERGEGGGAAPC